jgi:hypothetical protein
MTEFFVRDITEGIAGTGVKAGMLKCAVDEKGLTNGVEQVLRSVAQAHSRTGTPITIHTHAAGKHGLGACAGPAGVPRALAAYEELRRDRTARVQLGSRRMGAGYDSSGSQLTDRRWIYGYDAWAEAVALTRGGSPGNRLE